MRGSGGGSRGAGGIRMDGAEIAVVGGTIAGCATALALPGGEPDHHP
ncbi:hypothetical protein AB0D04_26630 [Streptomyces sp. NPDC048483]